MKALVVGGAGFIGSYLCEELISRFWTVTAVDDLSLGKLTHFKTIEGHKKFNFLQLDVRKDDWFKSLRDNEYEVIFDLAANSDISLGLKEPRADLAQTFTTTLNCLEAAKVLKIPRFVFASSSAVYGDNPPFPTPENCSNMHPVSIYGAGKLASEALISAYVNCYGIHAKIFRFGNVVGARLTHGVIFDFVKRLKNNPEVLDVLGNGTQTKTYIDVMDCISGMLWKFDDPIDANKKLEILNLSSPGSTSVKKIADWCNEICTGSKVKINYQNSSIGWIGDVPRTALDISQISATGWQAKLESDSAVKKSIKDHYDWSK